MNIQQNTLYVFTEGAYLRRDHQSLVVEVEKKAALTVPVQHLNGVAIFCRAMVSPSLMTLCLESGVTVAYLTPSGRMLARVEGVTSGNVLLRREQYRRADRPEACLPLARAFVAGKLHNARSTLLRAARESDDPADAAILKGAGDGLKQDTGGKGGQRSSFPRSRGRGRIETGIGRLALRFYRSFSPVARQGTD